MPRAKKIPTQDRAALLAKLPAGTKRVRVKTEEGVDCYRDLGALEDTDYILTKGDGTPIVMLSTPGRRPKPAVEPVNDLVKEILKRKEAHLDDDVILNVIKQSPDSPDVLHQIMIGLGDEVASLSFERTEVERRGKETSQVSMRRINALKALGDTWLKRKEQVLTAAVDMDSPGAKAYMSFVFQTMKEAMASSGLRPEMVETVFARFSKIASSSEWESEAKARIKQVV